MSETRVPMNSPRVTATSTNPDRPLGGAFGTLTLRELYVGLALLGHASRLGSDAGTCAVYSANRAIEAEWAR